MFGEEKQKQTLATENKYHLEAVQNLQTHQYVLGLFEKSLTLDGWDTDTKVTDTLPYLHLIDRARGKHAKEALRKESLTHANYLSALASMHSKGSAEIQPSTGSQRVVTSISDPDSDAPTGSKRRGRAADNDLGSTNKMRKTQTQGSTSPSESNKATAPQRRRETTIQTRSSREFKKPPK